jgi:hypothetical protein
LTQGGLEVSRQFTFERMTDAMELFLQEPA